MGTGRGGGAIFMRAWLDAHDVADRKVWVADRFRAAEDGRQAPALPPDGVAWSPFQNLVWLILKALRKALRSGPERASLYILALTGGSPW